MKSNILRKVTATLLTMSVFCSTSLISALTVQAASGGYSDVPSGKWYTPAITEVSEKGLMLGVEDGIFDPLGNMTRAQMVTLFARMAGADIKGMSSAADFTDVKKDSWFADAIGWAASVRLVNGYEDGTFMPNSPITRAETAILFVRYIKHMSLNFRDDPVIDSFSDIASIPKWARDDIESMRLCGLMKGDENNRFNYSANVRRAEIATILQSFINKLPEATDEMYDRFDRIYELGNAQNKVIPIKLGGTSTANYSRINTEILKILGLSEDKYETVLNEVIINNLKASFTTMSYGASVTVMLPVIVKNTESGAQTDRKNIFFEFSKNEEDYYVDPDEFDSGIDAELYSRMIDASLYSTGDIARLADVMARAERGEETTLAYIGGSLTQGASAGKPTCFAKLSYNYFQKHYSTGTVNYINAGIGGTSSDYGNFRLKRDVLDGSPDVVFVEYAVNDIGGGAVKQESFESLVRTVLNSEGSPAVVILLCMSSNRDAETYEFMKKIADRYSLPVVDMNTAVWMGVDEGAYTFEEFCPDNTHPEDFGHGVLADAVENLFDKIAEMRKTATEEELRIKSVDVSPITESRFENSDYIDSSMISVESYGSFRDATSDEAKHFDTSWTHTNGTDAMKFVSSFRNLSIAVSTGDESVKYYVRIDGGDIISATAESGSDRSWRRIYTGDAKVAHTVEIWVDEECSDAEFIIDTFGYN